MRQQVAQLGMGASPAWINNQQDWPDVYGLGADSAFGVFGTTWYHYLDLPGVDDFVKKYQARWPDTRINVPGNVTYNGYVAMRELLRAIERADSTNNMAIPARGMIMAIASGMRRKATCQPAPET